MIIALYAHRRHFTLDAVDDGLTVVLNPFHASVVGRSTGSKAFNAVFFGN